MAAVNITATVTVAKMNPTNFNPPRSTICNFSPPNPAGLTIIVVSSKCVIDKVVPPALYGGNLANRLSPRISPRHERHAKEREGKFAALVGAAIADLHDAPCGTRVRCAPRFDFSGEADRVAGQHRNAPTQLAKSRRRSPYRDPFAARGRLAGGTLALGNNHLDRKSV